MFPEAQRSFNTEHANKSFVDELLELPETQTSQAAKDNGVIMAAKREIAEFKRQIEEHKRKLYI